jgi:hypothetical protein
MPATSVTLTGSVTDDGTPPAQSTVVCTQVSGPAPAVLAAADAPSTGATFPTAGTYVLRLTANDGALSASDDVTVTVSAASPPNGDSGAAGPPPPPLAPATDSGGGGSVGLLEVLLLLAGTALARAARAGILSKRAERLRA